MVEIAGNQHPGMKPGDIIGEWPADAPHALVNSDGSAAAAPSAWSLRVTSDTNIPTAASAILAAAAPSTR